MTQSHLIYLLGRVWYLKIEMLGGTYCQKLYTPFRRVHLEHQEWHIYSAVYVQLFHLWKCLLPKKVLSRN